MLQLFSFASLESERSNSQSSQLIPTLKQNKTTSKLSEKENEKNKNKQHRKPFEKFSCASRNDCDGRAENNNNGLLDDDTKLVGAV